jgi:hypothetical protein
MGSTLLAPGYLFSFSAVLFGQSSRYSWYSTFGAVAVGCVWRGYKKLTRGRSSNEGGPLPIGGAGGGTAGSEGSER